MLSGSKLANRFITYLGTSCDVNLAVQPQKIARYLQILEVKELHYLCSENKSSDQLYG